MKLPESDVILKRMTSLHPKVIDLTLDRVWRLLYALDNPQDKLAPVIHIAGTNGKGSTLAMIRAGLEGAGLRTQAYTSPHLMRFNERIRLTDGLIAESALAALLDECWLANRLEPITYFEITTGAALLAFSRERADYCLLEVGLGGRLDATNAVSHPALTVITPVSLDHQQFLGDTIAQIAQEKAGILKPGTPCVVGIQQKEALAVIKERAKEIGAPLRAYGQHWLIREDGDRVRFEDSADSLSLPRPCLWGPHQIQNAGMALAALRELGQPRRALETAMTRAEWPGRMQRILHGPLPNAARRAEIWLDGGHNAAAGKALAAALAELPDRSTHLVCAMLRTKDTAGFLRPLANAAKSLVAVPIPGETAALPVKDTVAAAHRAGLNATAALDVIAALKAISATSPDARILICGSLYLAGHVLRVTD